MLDLACMLDLHRFTHHMYRILPIFLGISWDKKPPFLQAPPISTISKERGLGLRTKNGAPVDAQVGEHSLVKFLGF